MKIKSIENETVESLSVPKRFYFEVKQRQHQKDLLHNQELTTSMSEI